MSDLADLGSAGDLPGGLLDGEAARARLRHLVGRGIVERAGRPTSAHERLLPLTGATEHLLPAGGLPRGWVVEVSGAAGATTLALALAAGPSRTGSWVACVGFPQLGWEAVGEVGLDLERVVAVRTPAKMWDSREWAKVVAALLDAFDVVLCGPEVVPAPAQLRGLQSRARERGAVLMAVPAGPVPFQRSSSASERAGARPPRGWPAADARLEVQRSRWHGLGDGWGSLGRRRLEVVVQGRRELSRLRQEEVVIDRRGRPQPRRGPVSARLESATLPEELRPRAPTMPVPLEQAG